MNRPREDGKLFYVLMLDDGPLGTDTIFFIIYIEAEILRIKPRLRFLKRIDIILCVETSVNTIQFSFVFFNRIKQPLLVNKEFTVVITLDCP